MSAIEGVVAYQVWSLRGVPLYITPTNSPCDARRGNKWELFTVSDRSNYCVMQEKSGSSVQHTFWLISCHQQSTP